MDQSVTEVGLLRHCLAVLSDSPVSSYEPSVLLSSLHEQCTKLTLELARVKALAGHPNNPEVQRFLNLLARHDENYAREAEDFDVKCAALAADLSRVLDIAGRPLEAEKFTLMSTELSKRYTIKGYLIDTLFKEVASLVNRSVPSLRSPENSDFFFSGWASVHLAVAEDDGVSLPGDFHAHLLELRPRELRITDKDNKSIQKFSLDNVSLSVSLAPQREIFLAPLVRVREVPSGPSLELWTKAFARSLNN
jgi:hypothetical protein